MRYIYTVTETLHDVLFFTTDRRAGVGKAVSVSDESQAVSGGSIPDKYKSPL